MVDHSILGMNSESMDSMEGEMLELWMALNPDERKWSKEVYEYTKNLCYYIAYGILHDTTRAEDVVQETMIRVIENLDKTDPNDRARTKSFVAIICRHIAIDAYRERKRTVEFDEAYTAPYSHVERDIITKDETARALAAVDALPERYRTVLMLYTVHELSYQQIADALHMKEPAVRKRVQRGREMLAAEFDR